jgi:hypothetical protein
MRARLPLIIALSTAVVALAASPAGAAVHGPMLPMGVLGIDFPSVKSIVSDVVKFFFSTLLDALVPDWLKDGSVKVIRRLVTVPNPTDRRVWPTLGRLSEGMRWIALPLLSLAVVASWVQQWLRETTGRPGSVAVVLPRTILAVLLLIAYPTLIENAVALVNSVTNALLSLPAVQHGLQRTVGLVFAGTLLSGNGVLLALLGIAAVLLAVGLFMLSVGLLTVFAIAFVSAPIAIVCSVLDETRGIWTAWRYTLLTAALIPVGWCVLFATAGAFMLDMTTWSGGIGGTIGARFVGVFAALIILWLALRWPLMLWSTIRMHLGGALLSVGRTSGTSPGSTGARAGGRAARAALQRTSLRAGDAVSGALGATRTRAATSARMALGDGARTLARIPGAGALAAVGGGAAGAVAAGVRPVAAVAARVARPVLRGAEQVRARGRAAAGAAKSAYAAGSSSRQAAGAGLSALGRTGGSGPSRQPASAGTSRRGNARPTHPSGAMPPAAGERNAANARPPSAARRPATNSTPPRRTSSTTGRAPIQTIAQPTSLHGTSRPSAPPSQPTRPRPTPPPPRTSSAGAAPVSPAVPSRRLPAAPTPPSRPRDGPVSGRPSGRSRPKGR